MTVTPRIGAEIWLEVVDFRGRFYVHHDASVLDLVRKMQAGGYWVHPLPERRPERQRRT